jgi:5'-nucleotidase
MTDQPPTDPPPPRARGHRRKPGSRAVPARPARPNSLSRAERRAIDREHGEPLAVGPRSSPIARMPPRAARPLDRWETRPRILITNDDGIESRGLLSLKKALEPIGDTYVVAPETNQSAVGHSKTFMRPLRVRERVLDDGSVGWSVDGSPTDAVSLAFLGYFEIGFDLVASGINYGTNLGDDVTYSGTVSAAMEAVLSGCPAFAISQEFVDEPDFTLAGLMAALTARNILEHGLDPGELLNINVPGVAPEHCPGIALTRMGKRVYQDQLIERMDPRGVPYYWIGGPPPSGLAEPGTDFHALVNRYVAVTPIQLDLTAQRLLQRIDGWTWQLEESAKPPELEQAAKPRERADAPKSAEAQFAEVTGKAGHPETT